MKSTRFVLAAFAAVIPMVAMADGALPAFDVAEDLSRFVYDEAPVFEDGMPAYGNAFVTQGYVYPTGTLDGGIEGTLKDGSPAFPDKVIGTWTCDGYYVGNGFRTETGTVVITRQVIVFKDGDILITQGPELAETGVEVVRAVTGGTGDYARAPVEISQTLLGMSDGYGVRLQMRFAGQAAQSAGDVAAPTLAGADAEPSRSDYR
ncbi:hypothetical protein [Sinorhizobium alkalisoli]|uniref:hypothetical protein n=1 Tax=Sinorhizobium alkalisoli TaxID=1752398 RepID=UPI0012A897F6|nr:hypothetical protein [Sinorhizobium alkalisoli]MCA1493820.1 hypothetical protein [Ensifer sp. NBAIM29]MCG5480811.1 hypothetical protein [Sinorhizobium alkalisoli]QFI66718.1 hypothetical protein EKH55_1844 [Sinorhizobium alkalisoli]